MADVVTQVAENPKRAGTGAWLRYQAYQVGRTREDLMAMGLSKRDIDWDTKEGHVVLGEGERSTSPLSPPVAAPEPAARTPRSPASGRTSATPPTATPDAPTGPQAVSAGQGRPPVSLTVPGASDAQRLAPWYKLPVRIEATAPEGDSGRTWTITAVFHDKKTGGEVLRWRTVGGDRLGLRLVEQILLSGCDGDSWTEENDGKPGN